MIRCNSSENTVVPGPVAYESYEQLVEAMAVNKIDSVIPNGVPAHAAILIGTMFKHAQQSMSIFCGALSDDVYVNNNLISNAKDFVIKRGGKLRILLENDLGIRLFEKPLIYEIAAEIYRASEKDKGQKKDTVKKVGSLEVRIKGQEKASHFCVMDESAYRLEMDKDKRTAIANFGDVGIAKQLSEGFGKMFQASREAFAAQ